MNKKILDRDRGLKFARTVKTKKRPTGKPESVLQAKCEEYLGVLGYTSGKESCGYGRRFIRVPDRVYRMCSPYNKSIPIWAKVDISKYFKGVPDLIIFHESRFLAIELKREGKTARQAQKKWMKGIDSCVIDNFKDFKSLMDNFEATI